VAAPASAAQRHCLRPPVSDLADRYPTLGPAYRARTETNIRSDRRSPHSLRHTFATSLDDAGVPLQDIQDAMGHADPRTTRRYMATHQHLDRHATYAFAAWLRRKPDNKPTAD